jgi:hypothetical protein
LIPDREEFHQEEEEEEEEERTRTRQIREIWHNKNVICSRGR